MEVKELKPFYKKDNEKYKGTVLMQHGMFGSADDWVVNSLQSGNHTAPALKYFNDGYDVWLGNNRGSKYNLANTGEYKDPNDLGYWQFSF